VLNAANNTPITYVWDYSASASLQQLQQAQQPIADEISIVGWLAPAARAARRLYAVGRRAAAV